MLKIHTSVTGYLTHEHRYYAMGRAPIAATVMPSACRYTGVPEVAGVLVLVPVLFLLAAAVLCCATVQRGDPLNLALRGIPPGKSAP